MAKSFSVWRCSSVKAASFFILHILLFGRRSAFNYFLSTLFPMLFLKLCKSSPKCRQLPLKPWLRFKALFPQFGLGTPKSVCWYRFSENLHEIKKDLSGNLLKKPSGSLWLEADDPTDTKWYALTIRFQLPTYKGFTPPTVSLRLSIWLYHRYHFVPIIKLTSFNQQSEFKTKSTSRTWSFITC